MHVVVRLASGSKLAWLSRFHSQDREGEVAVGRRLKSKCVLRQEREQGLTGGALKVGARCFNCPHTRLWVLHQNLRHSTMSPPYLFYLSPTLKPHPGSSQPWGVTRGVVVWIMFFCFFLSSQTERSSSHSQKRAVISTVIHTHTKLWFSKTNLSHRHTDTWWFTHRNMNSSLHWGGFKEKGSTEIDLLLTATGSKI